MSSKRVLVVVHGFPPQAEGGSEVYVHAQSRALVRGFGDEVLVLTREQDRARDEYSVRTEERDGLRIVWINNTFRKTRTFEESYRNEAIGSLAQDIIDDFRPDVAHIHHLTCLSTTIVPSLAGRRIPILLTLHDYWLMCHRGQLFDVDLRVCSGPDASGCCRRCLGAQADAPPSAFLAAPVLRTVEAALPARAARALRHAAGRIASAVGDRERGESQARQRVDHMRRVMADVTRFLAPSRYIREQFIRFGVPAERIVHAPYGFDHAAFAAPRLRGDREAGRHVQPLRLGFIGALMVSKAPHLLIEASRGFDRGAVTVDLFGAQTDYHGDDSYRRRLAPLLASDGVRHHGPVPHARIPQALASIDVLVVTSVWPENSPLVIHEAFLAGVPVIASRIGGIPELVEHEVNGLLFEPGDSEGLHRAIARVLREPGLLERLRAGITPVRTIEDDVASTREMYQAHAGQKRASRQRLAAVVLNYRTPDDTWLAVRSLAASTRLLDEIIVVDNDDPNVRGAAAFARQRFDEPGRSSSISDERRPVVTYLSTGRNLGFSGGVNIGIRAALERGADSVLLVNSDVIVPPDCVERLERALSDAPRGGIAGPVIAARTAPGVMTSSGISYDPTTGRMRHCEFGDRVSARERPVHAPVDAVSACVMLVRREVFDRIGLFDEDYFFSFEDVDFCLRARRAGFETIAAGRAIAYHESGRSIGAASPDRLYFAARNHLLLASRVTPAPSAARHLFRTSTIVMLNLAHAAISSGGSMPQRFAAVVRGTRDYLAGRYGSGRALEDAPAQPRPSDRAARSS